MLQDDRFSVAVIGAGPAGCAAGHHLSGNGRRVVVIDKLDRVGGLSRTIERNGARYDIGPHRYFTRAPRVSALWREVGADVLIEVHRLTRILYQNRLLHYPLRPLNALAGLGLRRSVAAVGSYGAARLRCGRVAREPASFEEWVTNQFGRVLYESFFKTYTEKVWGIDCRDIAASWAAQRIKGLNLPRAVLNALTHHRTATIKTLVDHFYYCRNGSGTMYERLAKSVEEAGGRIDTRSEVVRVRHDGCGMVESLDAVGPGGNRRYAADHFVNTMPLTELISRLDPLPPPPVLEAAAALRFRTHLSVNLLVEGNPFPDNWIYVHSPDVSVGRIANYRNFCASMCPNYRQTPLTFEYFAFPGDALERRSDRDLVDLALHEGRRMRLIDNREPADAFVVRSPAAYCVIQRGYERHVEVLREHLAGYKNLVTAGRAGMFKYNNQDHSIMTGLLAAENILGAAYDLWAVNIDAEYHESGTAPDLCAEGREAPSI